MDTLTKTDTGEEFAVDEAPEPETPDVNEDAEPDVPAPDDEPEDVAPALSEKEMEAMFKSLEKEASRHANRLSEIMGPDAQDLVPCELCPAHTPGFHLPVQPPEEVRQAVLAAIGMDEAPELRDDPGTKMCDYCEGCGETITGSKVQNQLTRVCPECMGNGWQTLEQAAQRVVVHETAAVAAQVLGENVVVSPVAYDVPNVDAWTRPKGHPNFGKNPVYMDASERAVDWEGAR